MIIIPHTQHHPTTRSRALSEQLRATIAEFRRREPKLTEAEIEAALVDAHASTHTQLARRRRLLVVALAGITFALGAGLVAGRDAWPGDSTTLVSLAAAVLIFVALLAALLLRSFNNR
ncbi:MAG: hypothetical protein ABI910_04340 [Gemmatimonadota bacterium]